MTFERRDPDDPDTPGEPSAADIDAAFAQIIAGWDNEGRSRWSAGPDPDTTTNPDADPDTTGHPDTTGDSPTGGSVAGGAPDQPGSHGGPGTTGPQGSSGPHGRSGTTGRSGSPGQSGLFGPSDGDAADPPTEELPAARFGPAAGSPVGSGKPADFPDFPDYPDDIDPADLDAAAHARTHGPPADDPDDNDDAEDHYVPPEPPPFPRPQPATVGAAALFLLGVVLLVAPWVIGFSSQYGLPLGLLSITGSLVWLGSRLRQGPPPDSGWHDGAQL